MYRATLALIIKYGETDGSLLLGRKKCEEVGRGLLSAPGGKLEPSETPIKCILREAEEELRLHLRAEYIERKEVARIVYHTAGKSSFFVHNFVTSIFDGELVETKVFEKPQWYPLSNLPFHEMFDADCYTFPRMIEAFVHAEKKFDAEIWYQEPAKGVEHIEIFPFDTLR